MTPLAYGIAIVLGFFAVYSNNSAKSPVKAALIASAIVVGAQFLGG